MKLQCMFCKEFWRRSDGKLRFTSLLMIKSLGLLLFCLSDTMMLSWKSQLGSHSVPRRWFVESSVLPSEILCASAYLCLVNTVLALARPYIFCLGVALVSTVKCFLLEYQGSLPVGVVVKMQHSLNTNDEHCFCVCFCHSLSLTFLHIVPQNWQS